jgi:hypothetical protein
MDIDHPGKTRIVATAGPAQTVTKSTIASETTTMKI